MPLLYQVIVLYPSTASCPSTAFLSPATAGLTSFWHHLSLLFDTTGREAVLRDKAGDLPLQLAVASLSVRCTQA